MPLVTRRHFCRQSGPLARRDRLHAMNPQASMTGVEWAALVLQVVATLAAAAAAIAARRSVVGMSQAESR
jgi:hypothetical protein